MEMLVDRDPAASAERACRPHLTIGPRVRKSPFWNATIRHGAKDFTVYNHMFMPTAYTDSVDEYRHLVNGVTLWDVGCERQIEVSGPDAARFVQFLTPRNLSRSRAGQCKYVLLSDERGGVVNDAVLLHVEENRYWFSPGDGDVLLWARGIAVHSGMDVEIREPDVSPLQLQGPLSPQVGYRLFGDLALDLRYYHLRATELDGIPVVLSRTGWSGELGYEIFLCDSGRGDELWEAVMEAGRPFDIRPIAPSTIRSIEGGILSYGSDITSEDDPYVLGLDRLVDVDQDADFIGKEALGRIRDEGPRRRLVSIEIDGAPLPGSNHKFWPVCDGSVSPPDNGPIGRVTRCAYSPRLQKNIGLANIQADKAAIGTRFRIAMPQGEVEARVVATPFIQAVKKIPRPLRALPTDP